MRALVLTTILAGAPFVTAACRHDLGSTPGEQAQPGVLATEEAGEAVVPPELVDTSWRLVRLDGRGLDPELPAVTLRLLADRGEGSAGCNWYTAWLEAPGPSQLTVAHLAVTRRDCLHPRLMDREARFLEALETIESYGFAGDELILTVEGGGLEFRTD
jgi:heat shock protein HslJ